jgi:hypothetical protein
VYAFGDWRVRLGNERLGVGIDEQEQGAQNSQIGSHYFAHAKIDVNGKFVCFSIEIGKNPSSIIR